MIYPVPLSSSYCTGDAFLISFPPQFFICDLVGPPYLEDIAKTFVHKDLQLTLERFCGFPGFRTIQQYRFYVSTEYSDLGVGR